MVAGITDAGWRDAWSVLATQVTAEVPAEGALHRPVVVVIGDFLLDSWWEGRSDRLCREAPVPVVDVHERREAPGGAGNTALNLAALGARVRAVGLVGTDPAGRRLRSLLAAAGVDVDFLVPVARANTPHKTRIVSGGRVLVRADHGGFAPDPALSRSLAAAAFRARAGADAEVIADYDSGLLDGSVVRFLARPAHRPALTVVDAHDVAKWSPLRPHLATPNAAEAGRLLRGQPAGHEPAGHDRVAAFAGVAAELRQRSGAQAVIVTLDRDGSILLDGATPPHRTRAVAAAEDRAAGAGDTYVAVVTLARALGLPLAAACDLAQRAADVVVRRPGTSVCTLDDLAQEVARTTGQAITADRLDRLLDAERAAGRRLVLTNGCFDVLHRGHVTYLDQARRLGDVLLVAVNDDDSTRRLKGPGRPVNPVEDRMSLLNALSCVDYVVPFDTDTPIPLIRRFRPEIYAKGGDYTPEMLEESAVVRSYGGEVHILDYVAARSTTALVQKIVTSDDLRRSIGTTAEP